MNEDTRVELARITERMGAIAEKATASADAAHKRIDKLDVEIKEAMKEVSADIKQLLAYMHTEKGSKKTWAVVASLATALAGAVYELLKSKGIL